jgi:pro-apoptotic serine protease NMA111
MAYLVIVEIIRNFVRIFCIILIKLDGYPYINIIDFELIVDFEKGLVIVLKAVILYDLCDIRITIADSVIVDSKILFLHPFHNYAIIQYDSSLI